MLKIYFPILAWLRYYDKMNLRGDLTAGLTVAVMLVPQAMAYAMLAGLPPVVGLYASTLPILAYVLLGSSRHLAEGPVAMASLLVFAACSKEAQVGSQEYISLAVTLTILVGMLQMAAGLLKLGFVANFFSHAVLSGFTSAAAIVICLSQMKHFLGIQLPNEHSAIRLILIILEHLRQTNPATLVIGICAVVGLAIIRKKYPRFPSALLLVVAGTLIVYLFKLSGAGVKTVGTVPGGLPGFYLPHFNPTQWLKLIPAALAIVFVGYMESISVARYVATKEKYEVDANSELRGLGLANIVSSMFSGYIVTGGFSRTAVNYQAGAKTGLASIITAVVVMLTLLILTPLFYYLPNTVLAAIIIVAVVGLIDFREPIRLLKIKPADALTLALTFICTLALGVEWGILIGAVFSLGLFIRRSAHPYMVQVGYLESEDVFRNIERYPKAQTYPDILMFRVDASLYFANMRFVEDRLRQWIERNSKLKWVLFDFSGVNDIDAVAISTLENIIKAYSERGIGFVFCSMKGPVRDLVAKAGWQDKYQENIRYDSLQQALKRIRINSNGSNS
ncbi:SulP family inorganic anion transporter [Planctomycetota bacterium]